VTELQQNRYDQLLRRVGDLKGPGSKVNDVLQELFPTIDVENVPGELLFLMGTRIGWASTSVSPGGGNFAGIQLFNPADSGQLITVSGMDLSMNSTGALTYGIVNSTLPINTDIPRFRDSRVGIGPTGIAELRTSTSPVAPASGRIRAVANVNTHVGDRNGVCVLTPGFGLSVVAGTVAVLLDVTFYYRERVAEPSELNF